MQPKWTRRLGIGAIVGAVVWGSAGCAQERDPINRVQPNALDKSFFVGADLQSTSDDPEFYMRNTVVDVPYGAAQDGLFNASYAQPLGRIKWEIQQNALIARQTYEHIQDSDHNGNRRTDTGQVVAMFAIESHFDIRRSYNPQTGEELNIVEENSSDRPWYQRQYMRVDWSRNMVTDGYEVDSLSQLGLFGGIHWDPLSYYVSDPNDPNAPQIATDQGYFDVTTKAFASPQIVDTPFGAFPACFLPTEYGGMYPIANCNPTEVTLRLAFKKVVDNDYEPNDWDGQKMDAFGWFTQDRYGYERNYGVLDQKWHRFAAKYNIWQHSHVDGSECAVDYWRDENGNIQNYKVDASTADGFAHDASGLPIVDPAGQPFPGTPIGADPHRKSSIDNYTEADCAFTDNQGNIVHPGSRCDEFSHKCTLPLHERKIKTIPWYYGPDSPPDLFPSTNFALDSWNIALKRAALIGMKADGERLGFDMSTIVPTIDETALKNRDASVGADKLTDVFVLCHNPVVQGDDPACGKPGLVARLGDIRYNSVNIINNPQTPSPWGIMVDADDPLTGEKVATSVNEWGHVLDLASQGTEDLLRWINGEISDSDIASGKYLHDWVASSQLGTAGYQAKTLSQSEIQSRLGSIDTSLSKFNGLTAADMKQPLAIRSAIAAQNLAKNLGPSQDANLESARQALIGSSFETMMATPDNLQMGNMDPATPVAGNDAAISRASLLRGNNPGLQKWLHHQKEITMAKRASCEVEQPEPDALVGMARQAARLYPLPDKKDPDFAAKKQARDQALHQWIREQFHISVIAHEMGHSMGLRHNFTGSVDSLNYHQEYWKLRTRNGVEKACKDATTPHTNGEDCVGPRWIDPVTDTEVNNLIWKWGSSTVMDYPGDQTQDMNDIGAYDKAAMRFCYGEVADVDNDAVFGTDKGSAYQNAVDGFGGIGGNVYSTHYSTFNDTMNILGKCTNVNPADPLSSSCAGFDMDYVPLRDMTTVSKLDAQFDTKLGQWTSQFGILNVRPDLTSNFAVAPPLPGRGDPKGKDQSIGARMRHPYMFGSDEFADFGNVPVFRFDAGADAYEQIQFLISTYENRYIFDNFRRDKVLFSTRGAIGRSQDRYFGKLQGIVKSLALLSGEFGASALSDPGSLMPMALGGSDVLAMFSRILTRPEPGPYATALGGAMPYAEVEDLNGQINNPNGDFKVSLGSGEGRYIHNDYDYTKGYWWADYQTQAGTFAEKEMATYYLLEAYNNFVSNSKQDYIDGRYKNLNFFSIYPNQVRRLMTAIMQGDPLRLGSYVTAPAGNNGNVSHVQYLPWEKWDGSGVLDYPTGATVVAPLVGWEQQFPGLIMAWWFGSTMLTTQWADMIRVWTPDGTDAITVLPKDQVRFRDPVSGLIYAARTFGTETVNSKLAPTERTIGARMVQYANELAAKAYTSKGTTPADKDGFTYPDYDVATPKDNVAAQQLTAFVSNLDVSRLLAKHMGTFGGH